MKMMALFKQIAAALAAMCIVGLPGKLMAQAATPQAGENCFSTLEYHADGLADEAQIAHDTQTLKDDPKNIDALLDRAKTYRSIGKDDLALADYTQILSIDPHYTAGQFACNLAVTYWIRGQSAFKQEDAQDALNDYNSALQADPTIPTYAPIYVDRGEVYEEEMKLDLALSDFNAAITSLNDARAYADRGIVYQLQGNLKAALDDLNTALQIDSHYFYAYYTRSEVFEELGDDKSSLADLDILIDNMPFSNAYVNRGALYTKLGNYDSAASDFDQAAKLDSENKYLYLNRGYLYVLQGKYDEALADEDEAISLDPAQSVAYLYRCYIYDHQSNYDAAVVDATQAIALDPSYVQAYFARAVVNSQQGKYDAAISDYSQAIRLAPSTTDYYTYRGNAYFMEGNHDAALADYNRVIELAPSDPDSYIERGDAYEQLGNDSAARADFDHAIELDPSNPSVYLSVATLYAQNNEQDKAAADYFQYVQLEQSNSMDASELQPNGSVTLEMKTGQVYRIPFQGQVGDTVTIAANSPAADSVDSLFVLLGPDQQPLVADDDSGGNSNALISKFKLPTTGKYWIILTHAGGNATGRVTVTLMVRD